MSVAGTGPLPVTVTAGRQRLRRRGRRLQPTGAGDAPVTLIGDVGNDFFDPLTPGPVTIEGGPGDDFVDGGGTGIGQETVSLGDGDDRFRITLDRDSGEVSDTLDAGAGQDALEITGAFASESMGCRPAPVTSSSTMPSGTGSTPTTSRTCPTSGSAASTSAGPATPWR